MSKTTNRSNTNNNPGNNRREFLTRSATAAAGLGLLSLGVRAQPLSCPGTLLLPLPPRDLPGTHNMLVVGEQTAYLSHLPMFDSLNRRRTDFVSPHRYQIILEATFTDGDKNLTEAYAADRVAHAGEKMYSINPALFVLPDLDPDGKALKSFRGNTIFRGHLERQNTPIIGFMDSRSDPPRSGVFDVNVTRVVHFHKLTPGAAKPAQLQYILFGKGAETFMAHFIAQPPDFDQVIGVKVNGQQFTDEQLANGIKATFAGRTNTAKTRLKETQKVLGMSQLAGTDRKPLAGSNAKPLEVEVIKEFYFEEGELRIPALFDPTAEEKNAGFGE
jgi:hypothetical protein